MLGVEPQLVAEYVETGQLKIIFWPIIDFGQGSHNAQAAAYCTGQQSADAYWLAHDTFFANFSDLPSADRDYYAAAADSFGVDRATFEACYDSGDAHQAVASLDEQRRQQGISFRPTFDIEGQLLFGNQPFEVFQQTIEAMLP